MPRSHRRRRDALVLLLAAGGGGLLGAWTQCRPGGGAGSAGQHVGHDDLCFTAPALPYDPASGLPPFAARVVPAHARCPVCGMFPARRPEWAAQVLFDNGDAQFLDSPASLVLFLRRLERYAPGRRRGEVAASYVNAARGTDWVRAEAASFVQGPGIVGPMRNANYLPFADAAEARVYAAAIRGARVLRFEQLLLAAATG